MTHKQNDRGEILGKLACCYQGPSIAEQTTTPAGIGGAWRNDFLGLTCMLWASLLVIKNHVRTESRVLFFTLVMESREPVKKRGNVQVGSGWVIELKNPDVGRPDGVVLGTAGLHTLLKCGSSAGLASAFA